MVDVKKPEPQKVVDVKKPEEEVDLTTAWKGKLSNFFKLKMGTSLPLEIDPNNPAGYELSGCQWDFIFTYYPEYTESPYSLMS